MPLLAQEKITPTSPPKPSDLTDEWWLFYQEDNEKASERIDQTQFELEQTLELVSDENLQKGRNTVDRILTNLQAYQQVAAQPPPSLPTPKPIADRYTIDDIVELNRQIRQTTIELQREKDNQNEQLRKLSAAEKHLRELQKKYNAAELRTEKRILLGLDIIAYRSAIELTKMRLENLEGRVKAGQTSLDHLNEEMAKAVERVYVTPEKSSKLFQQVEAAKSSWNKAQNILNKKEIEAAVSVPSSRDPLSEAQNQLLSQEVIAARIVEMEAHNDLIFLEIEKALTELIARPEQVDISAMRDNIAQWSDHLFKAKELVADWAEICQEQIQSTSKIIALYEDNGRTVNPDLILLQQQIIRLAYDNIFDLQRINSEIEDSLFLLEEVDDALTPLLGGGERWLREFLDFIASSVKKTLDWLGQGLFNIGSTPVTLVSILRFFIVIILTIWVSRLIRRGLSTVLEQRRGMRKAIAFRIDRLVHYFVLTIGFIVALSALGFNFSNLILIAGALGVGLGFGLQSIFNNFVSGIIVLFESYLKVGDYIELETGIKGEVKAINFRTIILRTNDGVDILIPNSDVVSNRVINWTLNDPYRRVHIPFSVAYGTDKELVKRIVIEAAFDVEYTLPKGKKPDPQVRFIKFADSSLEFELAVWVNDKATRRSRLTSSAYLWAIDNVLRKHGITVPFPQRDVHISQQPPQPS